MPSPGDVIGSAFVEIRPEVSAFENALHQGLAGPMQRQGSLMGKIFTGAAVGLAGIATGAIAAVNHTIDLGQAAYEMGEKFGLSGKQASTFIAIGKLVGVSSDQMGIGMRTLSKQLNTTAIDLKNGASAATLSKLPLQELGIASTDASGHLRDMGPVLSDIADKFAAMPDGPQKAALATQLFGRAGTDLLPILNEGSKGIADLTAQAQAEGAIMSGPQVDAAHAAFLAHQRLNQALSGVALTLGSALMPYLAEAANWLAAKLPGAINTLHGWIESHKQDIEHWAGVIKDALVTAFGLLRDAIGHAWDVLKPFIDFAINHKQAVLDIGVAIAGLFAVKKVGSAASGWVNGVLGDLGRLKSFIVTDLVGAAGGIFGGKGAAGGGALSMLGVQKVFVVNMPPGGIGGGPGGSGGVAGAGGNLIPLGIGTIIGAGQLNTATTLQGGGAVLPGGPFGMSIPGLTSAMPAGGGAFGNIKDLFGTAQTGGLFGTVDTVKAEADLNAAMKNIHDLPGFTSMTVDQMRTIEELIRSGAIKSEPELEDYLRNLGILGGTAGTAVEKMEGILPGLTMLVQSSGLAAKSGAAFQGGVQALAAQTGAPISQIISAYTLTAGFAGDMAGYQQKINNLLATGVTLASGVEARIGSIKGSASGNEFPQGGFSWVGEKGKELAYLPPGSRVFPHGESLNMARGAASSNGSTVQIEQHFHINGGNPDEVQAVIQREMRNLVDLVGMR